MPDFHAFDELRQELANELVNNILPYWEGLMDTQYGGFYGRVTGTNECQPHADKGCILTARILWTFSAAARETKNKAYLRGAKQAKDFLLAHFYDKEYGGVYWKVDYKGNPVDTKKQMYALGFALYGLSEYFRATQDPEALQYAIRLFESLEIHALDTIYGGYVEATTRDWRDLDDVRLSNKDANEKKTMNTHLHLLEPYTNLFRVWKDPRLEDAIYKLICLFLDKIEDPSSHHLGLFFDEEWHIKGTGISYGHDIEASWLILESARELADYRPEIYLPLLSKANVHTRAIAFAGLEGLQPDGSLIYEIHSSGRVDMSRQWWVQAETVVGLYYLFLYHDVPYTKEMAVKMWQYIQQHLLDTQHGEWFWSPDNTQDDKAGFWKCPYHNSRMCLELMRDRDIS